MTIKEMRSIIKALNEERLIPLDSLSLDDVKWLKCEYGVHLKKTVIGGRAFIYADF